jgi:hypothetical protein
MLTMAMSQNIFTNHDDLVNPAGAANARSRSLAKPDDIGAPGLTSIVRRYWQDEGNYSPVRRVGPQ